jgi:hypothetical protein
MNEIAEKHCKYPATKTCKIKSENQVKGKVRTKTITKQYLPYLQLEILFKMSAVISIIVFPFIIWFYGSPIVIIRGWGYGFGNRREDIVAWSDNR